MFRAIVVSEHLQSVLRPRGTKKIKEVYCTYNHLWLVFVLPPTLAGKTHRDDFVHCCSCLSLSIVRSGKHLALPPTCFDGFQPKLGHRCNMGTFIS